MSEPSKTFLDPGAEAGPEPGAGRPVLLSGRLSYTQPDEAATARAWEEIRLIEPSRRHLARHHVVSATREDPASVSFDVLRTRLLQALRAHGWSRVGITSPTKGCGKTFTAANLAFSISHKPSTRTVLLDMDLRRPNLAPTLGLRDPGNLGDVLGGETTMSNHLIRLAPNLAVAANSTPVPDSAELLQEPMTRAVLEAMRQALRPDVVIYDLPPVLLCDDVIAFLPHLDGILLVADGHHTKAHEIAECERLFKDQTEILGVVLNRAEDSETDRYGYYGNA